MKLLTEDLGDGVTLDLVYIPSGDFMMGSPEGTEYEDEQPRHLVNVSSFYMSKYPITQQQWKAIATETIVNRKLELDPSYFKGDKLPVESISWDDAVEFCDRMSKKAARKYRLPTEAEWEYACRAGTTTAFHFGETLTKDLANIDRSRKKTTPVDSFLSNAFGLYDMHGNVWEWCEDDWFDNYQTAPNDGSAWRSQDSSVKVLRGGAWLYASRKCRCASRGFNTRVSRFFTLGFRVVSVAPKTK